MPAGKAKKPKQADDDDDAPAQFALPATPSGTVPNTHAAAVIVIDARSGEVLYEKNADAQRQAASTQKLLTSLIVAERGFLDRPSYGHADRHLRGADEIEYQSRRNAINGSISCAPCS